MKKMKLNSSVRPSRPSRTNTPKRCPFHYRGLEYKSESSRNTWSNRQIWPWSTEWSRAKANRVLPREHTGRSKHPLPTKQEKTLYMDITRWSTPKSDWLYYLQPKMEKLYHFSSVQSLSRFWLFVTPWIVACQASLSITNSWISLKLTSVGDAIQPSHPLSSPSPPAPSIRVFSNGSTLRMSWPKYWSFSFSISPSKEIPGLIFGMDRLHLLAVQGTLKSLLQHHSSKASILRHSAFFTVQLSHPYMTTGKTIALTRRT